MSVPTPQVMLVEVPGSAASTAVSQPPIVYFFEASIRLLSIVVSAVVLAFSHIWSALKILLSPVTSLFSALSSPIRYLLAPAVLLANILLEIFIYTPYKLLGDIGHALYPIYAFVFIVVVLATVVGFSAHLVVYLAKLLLVHQSSLQKSSTSAPSVDVAKPTSITGSTPVKKVQIKEEEPEKSAGTTRR